MKTLNPKIYAILLNMTYGCSPMVDYKTMLQASIEWTLELFNEVPER